MAESVSERDKKKERIDRATANLRKQIFGIGITAAEKATLRSLIASGKPGIEALRRIRQEPLAPRGKTESGSGIRIPVRSQQSIAKARDRRRARNR